MLDECGFMDMGFAGLEFTWHKHFPDYTIWERLDRAVATNKWFLKFSETKVYHLNVTSSDHKPLWIVLEIMECRLEKPFHFEQIWMSEKGCGETIEAVWGEDVDISRAEKILKKVDKCRLKLTNVDTLFCNSYLTSHGG